MLVSLCLCFCVLMFLWLCFCGGVVVFLCFCVCVLRCCGGVVMSLWL